MDKLLLIVVTLIVTSTLVSNCIYEKPKYQPASCENISKTFTDIQVTENEDGTCQGSYSH
jgi:hypothetical protein